MFVTSKTKALISAIIIDFVKTRNMTSVCLFTEFVQHQILYQN